jgi:hypothetical protein
MRESTICGVGARVGEVGSAARTGAYRPLARALDRWWADAALRYDTADFDRVQRDLRVVRALYGELTTAPTDAEFGPWTG